MPWALNPTVRPQRPHIPLPPRSPTVVPRSSFVFQCLHLTVTFTGIQEQLRALFCIFKKGVKSVRLTFPLETFTFYSRVCVQGLWIRMRSILRINRFEFREVSGVRSSPGAQAAGGPDRQTVTVHVLPRTPTRMKRTFARISPGTKSVSWSYFSVLPALAKLQVARLLCGSLASVLSHCG